MGSTTVCIATLETYITEVKNDKNGNQFAKIAITEPAKWTLNVFAKVRQPKARKAVDSLVVGPVVFQNVGIGDAGLRVYDSTVVTQ